MNLSSRLARAEKMLPPPPPPPGNTNIDMIGRFSRVGELKMILEAAQRAEARDIDPEVDIDVIAARNEVLRRAKLRVATFPPVLIE